MRLRASRSALLAIPALLVSCMQSQINVNVKSPYGTNQGKPMYMLVRVLDPKQGSTETYDDVAAKVGASDPNVLLETVIYPGNIQRFPGLKLPAKDGKEVKEGTVAISFLFTEPAGQWQMLHNLQAGNAVDIELDERSIKSGGAPSVMPPGAPALPEAPAPPEVPKLPKPPGA